MFLDRLFRKPSQPLRAVVATKSENLAVALQKQQRTAQLQQFLKDVPPEQKAEAIKRAAVRPHYEVVRSATAYDKSVFTRHERKAFAGMAVPPLKVGKA